MDGGATLERRTQSVQLLRLPFPPPLNNMYRNVRGKGRVKTDRYLTWRRVALNEMLAQKARLVPGPIAVAITLGRPDRRKRDLDGMAKGVLDALTEGGVIQDDSLVESLTLRWGQVEGAHVLVMPA